MIIFKENRKKIILSNLIRFSVLSGIFLCILNYYFPIEKSKTETILIIIFSLIAIIISIKNNKLEFDEENKILTIINSHILGGGSKFVIPYNDLQLKLTPHQFLDKLFNKSELSILNNNSRRAENINLQMIEKSDQLIKLLNQITKNN